MLNGQLQQQIEQEAVHEASMHFHPQYSPDQNTACRINYKNGASRYAALWQAAEEKAARYEKALNYIATFNLTSEVDQIDLSDAKYGYNAIIETARETLTPKTGEDEN